MRSGARRIGGAIVAALATAAGTLLLVGGPPAGAQTAATPDAAAVAAAIEQNGWYADPGSDPLANRLSVLARDAAARPHPIAFAVMAGEPNGSSQSFAYDVLDALPINSRFQTVIVLSPDDIGVDSDYWDDGAIDAALDATTASIRSDPGAGLGLLAADLADRPATTPDSGSDGSTGDDTGAQAGILLLVVVGIIVILLISWMAKGEQYERWGDDDEPYWDRRRRYQRYTSRSSSGGWRSSSSSSHRSFSSGSSHRSSSSGHSHRGSGGRRL